MSVVSKEGIVDLIKSATQVNLRYSAVALKLVRAYVREFDSVLRDGAAAGQASPTDVPPPRTPQPQTAEPIVRRAPILLAGRAGGQARGAFLLNNAGDTMLTVGLMTQGEIDPGAAELDPASFVLEPGGSKVVQISVLITDKMDIDRDYPGVVVAPMLAAPPIEFVMRRLPDATPQASGPKPRAPRGRADG